ncbi:MAG: vWA domain-containing protein [Myxococcota bacterium]
MSRWKLTAALATLALGAAFVAQQLLPAAGGSVEPPPPVVVDDPTPGPRDVDIVLCLDTSGSMDQLIDSARARLWEVVGEVAEVEPEANLRVGLLSFGSPLADGHLNGHVVLQTALTSDLDALYNTMWSLSTAGGDEYVGWVLEDALKKMPWSTDDDAARLIFVAGNESALQGNKDALTIAGNAHEQGFRINTLYAGEQSAGVSEHWHEVAEAGGGKFTAISMADGLVQIQTPVDEEIRRLNEELNATYVPYGRRGAEKKRRQDVQDRNARSLGLGSATTRTLAKGTAMYKNADWDLVDAVAEGEVELSAVPEEALPEPMQGMDAAQREAYLADQTTKRAAIKRRLLGAKGDREAWVKDNVEEGEGLGEKMKAIVAEQL